MDGDSRTLAQLEVEVRHLTSAVSRLEGELELYTRLSRFRPVELAVWGVVSVIVSTLLAAGINSLFLR